MWEPEYIWNLRVYAGTDTIIAPRHERDFHFPMGIPTGIEVALKLTEPLEGKGPCN